MTFFSSLTGTGLTPRVDRIRLWLDAMARYVQCRYNLVEGPRTGPPRVTMACAGGVAYDTAARHGAALVLERDEVTGAVFYRAAAPIAVSAYGRPDLAVRVHTVVDEWYGLDVFNAEVPFDVLPGSLRSRFRAQLINTEARWDDEPVRLARASKLRTDIDAGGYVVTAYHLNDRGVPLRDLADALRVVLGVDAHLVSGTPEHELALLTNEDAGRVTA